MTFKSFAFCTVNVQMQPDPLTWQSLKTTFQNSTPNMICDPIKSIYSSSQQTHKVSHQENPVPLGVAGVAYCVEHPQLETGCCCCNSSHNEA